MKERIFLISFIIIIILLISYIIYENTNLRKTYYNIQNTKISEEFNNYKIALISDFHNLRSNKLRKNIIKSIKKENIDIIVITGDILDSRWPSEEISINFIKELLKIKEVYYVTGNHESRLESYINFENEMKSLGVNVLKNEIVPLEKNNSKIDLIGIDDPNFFRSKKSFLNKLNELSSESNNYNILLSHRPEYFKDYVKNNFDLVLCGHTHAGQIRLPFIGALYVPDQESNPKYVYGLYNEEDTSMIISAGLGSSVIPVRTLNKPEVVFITLKNEEDK